MSVPLTPNKLYFNINCKPYVIRHRLGGKTEYIKFQNHDEYDNWISKHKYVNFEYYEYCHKIEFINKLRIYADGLKFPFNFPRELKK